MIHMYIYIYDTVCTYVTTYVPFSCVNRWTNLQLGEGSQHKHDPTNPNPRPRGTLNSKTQTGHGRENFV